VTNLDDCYGSGVVVDGIDYAVIAMADAVSSLAAQFLATRWPGIIGERTGSLGDPLQILFGDFAKFAFGGPFGLDSI